jgi:hypothetical protein
LSGAVSSLYARAMPLHPETCAHCAVALTLTQQAFETKLPPPEAIRGALLLGVVVGGLSLDAPLCEECRTLITASREKLEAPPEAAPRRPESTGAVAEK